MPWSDGLCQGQRYPSHLEGGWIVIAVWLTLNSSAGGECLLERLGHHRRLGTGSVSDSLDHRLTTSYSGSGRFRRSSSQYHATAPPMKTTAPVTSTPMVGNHQSGKS